MNELSLSALTSFAALDPLTKVFFILILWVGPIVATLALVRTAVEKTGALGSAVTGGLNKVADGVGKQQAGFRGRSRKAARQRAAAGNRFAGGTDTNLRGRFNKAIQTGSLMSSAGANPMRMRARMQSARSSRQSTLMGQAKENESVKAVLGNDDLLNAALSGDRSEAAARSYLQGLGQTGPMLEQNVASLREARREVGQRNFDALATVANAGTGTGYASGPAEMLQKINEVAGSDRALAGRMLASARGEAEKAKRVDLAGAGFGTTAGQMEALNNGTTTATAVNDTLTDAGLASKSAGEIASARTGGLQNMVPAIQRRVANSQRAILDASARGDAAALALAEDNHKRVLASTAALLDVAGQVSPDNAEIIGNVMGTGFAGSGGQTIGSRIETLRTDRIFQQYRREYGSAAAAAGAGGTATGGTGTGTPP